MMEINKEALDKDYRKELLENRLKDAGFNIQNCSISVSELYNYLYDIFITRHEVKPMTENEKKYWTNYYNGNSEFKLPPLPDKIRNHIPSGTKLISWDEYMKLHNNDKD